MGIFDKSIEKTIWDVHGIVALVGRCHIGHGSRIVVGQDGKLTFGNNFACTSAMSLICFKDICFGSDVLISWETLLMDTDFHHIQEISKDVVSKNTKPITVGNHVWIGCRSMILKGAKIGDESVIAAGSVVTGQYDEHNVLIGGCPSKIIKKGIIWRL